MIKREIGILIKKKRKEKQLSQKQLAALLNISDTAVSKWENGVNLPDIQNLEPLSKILDIPVQFFLDTPLPVRENNIAINAFPTNSKLTDSNKLSTDNNSLADHHLPTGETLFNHGIPPTDDSSVMLEDESEPKVKAPDKPESDMALSKKESTCFRGILRLTPWQTAASLFILLILGSTAIIYHVQANNSTIPSYTIIEEYYDDYDGEKAYYLIVEYTGKPTNQNILEYDETLRKTHSSCFNECAVIVIAYFEEGNFYIKTDICNSADYLCVLYPMLSQ